MEYQGKRIAFIIQARMGSDRLPGKVLMPLPLDNGKPLLAWIVDELKRSAVSNDIIIATSASRSDDPIELFAEQWEVSCHRGSERDVLNRFQSICRQNAFDVIVRFTADNPFVDIRVLEDTLDYHLQGGYEYTKTAGMPRGMNVEIINAAVLLDLSELPLTEADREHVTLYIKNSNGYKKGSYIPGIDDRFRKFRLTVDYPSDFTLASSICSLSMLHDWGRGFDLIGAVYARYPWLFRSNASNIQKKQISTEEELKEAQNVLKMLELNRAAAVLRKYESDNLSLR